MSSGLPLKVSLAGFPSFSFFANVLSVLAFLVVRGRIEDEINFKWNFSRDEIKFKWNFFGSKG